MALNLSQLQGQVAQMGQVFAERDETRRQRVQVAWQRLQAFSTEYEMLHAKALRTRSRRGREAAGYGGAILPPEPYGEPLAEPVALPPLPPAATLIAVDGSQVLPDRHGPAAYYLLSSGAIVLRHGSGEAPACVVTQELHYEEHELYDAAGELIPVGRVYAQRDLLMMDELARLAEQHAEPPALALVDGPLLLWTYQELLPGAERRHEESIQRCLQALDRVQAAGGLVAGYIEPSAYMGIARLLHLGTLPEDGISGEALQAFDLGGVHDADIYACCLEPGQRSALFRTQSHVNKTYKERGHEIWFFYLNVAPPASDGRSPRPTIARVELPAWVAQDQAALCAVHALLYQQCQVLAGRAYPYVLTRADELARVDPADKQAVDRQIQLVLMQRQLPALPSAKERSKQLTRRRQRGRVRSRR